MSEYGIGGNVAVAAVAVLCALGAAGGQAWGQCQPFKALASDGAQADQFGRAVAIDGQVAVIGSPADNDHGETRGSAYVFRKAGWSWLEETKLLSSDGQDADYFGCDVDIDGDVVIVGAYQHDAGASNSGAAYVFRYNGATWVEEAKLVASDGSAGDYFGWSVAISGDVVVIGVPGDDDLGGEAGSAYVFRHESGAWSEEAKFLASDGHSSDLFGSAVTIDGDAIVVGAPQSGRGQIYFFRRGDSQWLEEFKYYNADGGYGDDFGASVAIESDVVVVGAKGYPSRGAVYVFEHNGSTWGDGQRLGAWDDLSESFGSGVAVEGDLLAVGDMDADGIEEKSGAVYLFHKGRNEWLPHRRYIALDGANGDDLGVDVAISDGVVVGGAKWATTDLEKVGATYFFDLNDDLGDDCNNNGVCDLDDIDDGFSEDCNGNLFPDECDIDSGFSEDCNENDIPDECDVDSGYSDDCNDNGVPDECESDLDSDGDGVIDICDNCPDHYNPDQGDCDHDGIGDVCAIANGWSEDCNENEMPDECDIVYGVSQDCNENGIPDECDIDSGFSEDCNENGIPDECDIMAYGLSWDCNENGIPDECDIDSGYSDDVNGDGVPDECFPPGSEGVVALLQTRTLWVYGVDLADFWCEVEYYDEAADFQPYEEALEVQGCGYAQAAQQSSFDPAFISAIGSAYGSGFNKDRLWYYGAGESICEVIVGSPFTQQFTLSGQISLEYTSSDIYDIAEVVFLGPGGVVIFEWRLEGQEGLIQFNEPVELVGGAKYTLRARADSADDYGDGYTAYNVMLVPASYCPADVNGDDVVNIDDLFQVLAVWGTCDDCPEDINDDGVVDIDDVFAVLAAWGPC